MRKRLNLQEASSLTPYEKMDLFNQGKRRENLKACGLSKLVDYYRICLENKFKTAERSIAIELLLRKESAFIKPNPANIDASQFTLYEAKELIERKDNPEAIITVANEYPFVGLTTSETLTIYLIWAVSLEMNNMATAIKNEMKRCNTYYKLMPEILQEIMTRSNVTAVVADIINSEKL